MIKRRRFVTGIKQNFRPGQAGPKRKSGDTELALSGKDAERLLAVCCICQSDAPEDYKLVYQLSSGEPYQVLECCHCGQRFVNNDPQPSARTYWSDQMETIYDETQPTFEREFEGLLDKIEELLGKLGRLLEVGCGPGYLLQAARARKWEVIGIDVDAAILAGQKDWETFHGTVEQYYEVAWCQSGKPSFQCALFLTVLEHMSRPDQALKACRAMLTEEAVLVVEVPYEGSIPRRAARVLYALSGGRLRFLPQYLYTPEYGGHRQGFSAKTLGKLVSKCGFEVLGWQLLVSPVRLHLGQQVSGALTATAWQRKVKFWLLAAITLAGFPFSVVFPRIFATRLRLYARLQS